jgi:hypothetical protein
MTSMEVYVPIGTDVPLEEIQRQLATLHVQQDAVRKLDRIVWGHLSELNDAFRDLEREKARLEAEEARRRQPTSIEELLRHLDNEHQKDILRKLTLRNEEDRIYLSSYERNTSTDRKKQHILGTFHVFGSVRKGIRDSYTVQFYKEGNPKGSFWCSCPDHKFNSTRKNIVCKHIAFLVTRVGRWFQREFFETKQLSSEQYVRMLEIIGSGAVFQDNTLCRATSAPVSSVSITPAKFLERKKPIGEEDVCPICYDGLTEASITVSCPTCENNLHKECMEVWLERHDTCVYCRSNEWADYS